MLKSSPFIRYRKVRSPMKDNRQSCHSLVCTSNLNEPFLVGNLSVAPSQNFSTALKYYSTFSGRFRWFIWNALLTKNDRRSIKKGFNIGFWYILIIMFSKISKNYHCAANFLMCSFRNAYALPFLVTSDSLNKILHANPPLVKKTDSGNRSQPDWIEEG